MTKEYIDREALMKLLCSDNCGCVDEECAAEEVCYFAGLIADIPAADVAPVVHGRWEPRKDAPGFVRCSACKNCNTYDEWLDGKKWAYCPNCGAKMDGGASDNG